MKPIIFINPEELLEKGRPAAVYGQRKMQPQKRKKKNAKGEMTVVTTWVWMKKGHKKWEYDGMVSPSEKKVYDLAQRKTKKGDKLKTQTAARVKEAKAQAAADAAANASSKPSGPYKPTAAEIAAMPKKEQVYWDDPAVTKSRRELCDVTGILTMDDESEKYVKDNMRTIFTMSKEQKKLLTDLNINVPAGTDGKAFDDPIFIEDTLENLKSMYAMQMSKKEKEKREAHLRAEYATAGRIYEYTDEADYLAKAETALKETFEDMIEMFEKKTNDLILLNKMASWDKGIRGIKNMKQFDTMLARNILGEYPNQGGPIPWSTLSAEVRTMLGDYNIGPDSWEKRKWGASEIHGFQMSALNDEFRKNVFQPWLEVYGNLITRTESVQTQPAGSAQLITKQDIYWYEEALPGERIDTDINLLSHKASIIQSKLNPLTVQFMQDNFEYNGVVWDTDTMSAWKTKITDFGISSRNQALQEVASRGHVNLWNIDTIRDLAHKPSFKDAMAQDFGTPNTISAKGKYGVKRSATWRDFANGVKAMQRRKGFGSENSVDMQAIADTGKALGNTAFNSTDMVATNGFRTFHNAISKKQQKLVTFPQGGSLERYTDSAVGMLTGNGVQSLPRDGNYRRSSWHSDKTTYVGNGRPQYDVDLNTKKGTQSLMQYTRFQKTPSSSWRSSSAGKNKRKSVAYSVSAGAQGVGGAVKASFINYAARLDYDNMHRSEPFDNSLKQHVRASITTSIASNWQLRNMTKNDDIIPNWKWNPETVPFGDKNKMSRTDGVTSTTAQTGGNSGYISHVDFDRIVKDQYKNSVADTLGLRPSMKTLTTGKLKPSIVLKTSKETPAEALADINKHWSHASNTGVTLRGGHWASGSVKVNHVFDIMYHDYFDDYKQREKDKGNVQYAYHGTDFKAAASIMKGGYIVPRNAKNGRMFGDGVYMAKSSSKSLQYLREMGFGRTGNKGPLLVNRIAMGKTTDPLNPRAGIYDSSVDTIFAGGKTGADPNSFLGHDEWCVKDPKAIVPIKWIEVET